MSITFSTSDSLSSLLHHHRHEEKKTNATRLRDARTKRREKNFLRPQDRRAQNSSRFYHPRPFRRRLRNDLRKKVLVYILLHHRSTSRSRRRTHSARARARLLLLFLSPFYSRDFYERKQEEKKKTKCASSGKLFSRPRSFGTISDTPIFYCSSSSLDAWRRNRRRKTESRRRLRRRRLLRKRAPSRFYICGCFVSLSQKERAYF